MKEISLEAKVENLDEVIAFIDAELEGADCPMKKQMQIDVAVEEIFVNIASYAYGDGTGDATISMEIDGSTATITFVDSGMEYDPLKKEDPDVTLSAEERQIGGLGIFIVKKSMDDVEYRYEDGKNILTIVSSWG